MHRALQVSAINALGDKVCLQRRGLRVLPASLTDCLPREVQYWMARLKAVEVWDVGPPWIFTSSGGSSPSGRTKSCTHQTPQHGSWLGFHHSLLLTHPVLEMEACGAYWPQRSTAQRSAAQRSPGGRREAV